MSERKRFHEDEEAEYVYPDGDEFPDAEVEELQVGESDG